MVFNYLVTDKIDFQTVTRKHPQLTSRLERMACERPHNIDLLLKSIEISLPYTNI
jgi:hypothetical protein